MGQEKRFLEKKFLFVVYVMILLLFHDKSNALLPPNPAPLNHAWNCSAHMCVFHQFC